MNDEKQPAKKKYEQPKITVISLRPEEAVLGNCKSLSHSGPVGAGSCATVGNCATIGS
jgi:hypothetical protein